MSTEIILGIGCDRSTSLQTLEIAVDQALGLADLPRDRVVALATIYGKRDEGALLALSARHHWPLHFYSAAQLASQEVPNPSETVRRHMGTPAVAEAAAMLAANTGMEDLLLEKHKYHGDDGKNVTVSIVRVRN